MIKKKKNLYNASAITSQKIYAESQEKIQFLS